MISEYIRACAFFTIIILLIVHFVFLFKKNTSYISWIIGFVLFVIFPFTWIEDVINYSKTTIPKAKIETQIYYWGTAISLLVATVFEITTLIMTIMTNDYIRKKSNQEDDSQEEVAVDQSSDTLISKNTLKIRIMYVTTVSLIIGMVTNMFVGLSLNETEANASNVSGQTRMGLFIKNLFEYIPIKVNEFEIWWRNTLEMIPVPRLLKAFFLFCGGFLIPFFTIFVKVSPSTKWYDLYFPPMFRTDIKEKTYFVFLVLMLSFAITVMAVWFFSLLLPKIGLSNPDQTNGALLGIAILSFILNNVLFNEQYPANKHENDYIYLLISFSFALLGTPITFSILELIAKIAGQNLAGDIKNPVPNTFTFTSNALSFSIFVSYWLGIFLGGRTWITDLNNKKLRMIIVTIICMTIGMFIALSTNYKVFTTLLGFIIFAIRSILKYLGPATILALSSYQIFYANQSYRSKDNTTDDYNTASSIFKQL